MEYTIDAQNKKLGRIASEIAKLLMGKNRTDFARNVVPAVKVRVSNAGRMDITNKKLDTKTYKNYSGYPGGLKETKMKKLTSDKGYKEALRIAVHGMLPKNKLRERMMKNLVITD